jgi:ankyrin repeat protein
MQRVKTLLAHGANPNAKNGEGTPILMYAALYGDTRTVRYFLSHGADPNGKNANDATALIWAGGDVEKVRALVANGANVNAQSKEGRTPMHTAAAQDGAFEAVKLLVEKGANVNAADRVPNFATGGAGATPLMLAARGRDSRTTKYLIEHGANVKATDSAGGDALIAAARQGSFENVKLLLEHGADPKASVREFPFKGMNALTFAAALDRADAVEALLAAGADANAKDMLGYNALTWAAMSDRGDKRIVRALLRAGADPNLKGAFDETAKGYAARRGNSPIAAMLGVQAPEMAGMLPAVAATDSVSAAELRRAIAKSVPLMLDSGPKFFKVSGCVSCHNNTLPMMAARMARDRGIAVDEANIDKQVKMVRSMVVPALEVMRQATDALPNTPVVGGYILGALSALDYAPDEMTTAIVQNIVSKQLADGSWPNFAPRPPIENGDIQATAYALRSLQVYAPKGRSAEMQRRIAMAREWLRRAEPRTTEERVMQLYGLDWSGATRQEVETLGRAIVSEQRTDGGWAQLDTLGTDAYATGKVLVALRETQVLRTGDAPFQRGVAYLVRTQQADGAWLVKSRPFPFQPLKDSGFPNGRDQWISAAGTAWATMALNYALDAKATHIAAR